MSVTSGNSSHTSSPTVSVIIPAYDMAEFIGAAIASVVNGGYNDVEVIVVDDGSTDETEQVVRQFLEPCNERYDARVRYFSQPNHGKPVAVNEGLEKMRGSYFALLDADDRFPPSSLERRVDVLNSTPGADIAIGGFEVINESGTRSVGARSAPATQDPNQLKYAFCSSYKTPFHFNACLLHSTLVERVGSFDHRLNRCQDIDYSIRCMEKTKGIALVDTPVYHYRKHRESTRDRIKTRVKTIQHRPRVVLKNFSPPQSFGYVVGTVILDIAKLFYELFSSYKN